MPMDPAVDTSAWDASRSLAACSSAAEFLEICAGEHSVGTREDREHWALPHHFLGKGPNAQAVRGALEKLARTKDLVNRARVKRHLEDHLASIQSSEASANGRAQMDTPQSPAQMRGHLMGAHAVGSRDLSPEEAEAKHLAIHAAGSAHAHEGMRDEAPLPNEELAPDLRDHLLGAHNQDSELVPSTMSAQGQQQMHITLHAAGADHAHEGISNGTGVQPFGAGVKSAHIEDTLRHMLVRAVADGYKLRRIGDGQPPILFGHFARFGEWTEISSMFEGNFMEMIAPGAFARTIKNNASNMRVTFNHGHDVLGDQVLGRIADLREDAEGAYYEVELFRSVPPLILEGLEADQYGASFRFQVMRQEIVEEPDKSDHNPDGLPERIIKEAAVAEFGPVTYPAYSGATAGIRSVSLTDQWLQMRLGLTLPEQIQALVKRADAPSEMTPALATSSTGPR